MPMIGDGKRGGVPQRLHPLCPSRLTLDTPMIAASPMTSNSATGCTACHTCLNPTLVRVESLKPLGRETRKHPPSQIRKLPGEPRTRATSPMATTECRLHAQTGAIENGFVYLPGKRTGWPSNLHEITTFPSSKYDDQGDSTSQAPAGTKQRSPASGWIEGKLRHSVPEQAPPW
jgi:predicted phage terminase large subunit-like protein